MLTFLRKIRKSLIESGSARKPASPAGRYLLYAIGEIALVVIGILIALQINNWNETRKTKEFERDILRDIDKGLQLNIWQLEQGIKNCERASSSCEIILSYLENEINYHDSLQYHFSRSMMWFRPTVTNTGYESLKTYGRQLIVNDSIREQLEIFDYEWIHVMHERQEQFISVTAIPILNALFKSLTFSLNLEPNSKMIPFDLGELKRSREYYNIINTLKSNRRSQAMWYNNWLESIRYLSKQIERELD